MNKYKIERKPLDEARKKYIEKIVERLKKQYFEPSIVNLMQSFVYLILNKDFHREILKIRNKLDINEDEFSKRDGYKSWKNNERLKSLYNKVEMLVDKHKLCYQKHRLLIIELIKNYVLLKTDSLVSLNEDSWEFNKFVGGFDVPDPKCGKYNTKNFDKIWWELYIQPKNNIVQFKRALEHYFYWMMKFHFKEFYKSDLFRHYNKDILKTTNLRIKKPAELKIIYRKDKAILKFLSYYNTKTKEIERLFERNQGGIVEFQKKTKLSQKDNRAYLFSEKIKKVVTVDKPKRSRFKSLLVSIWKTISSTAWHLVVFSFSLILYISGRMITHIFKWRLFPKNLSQKFQEKLARFYTRTTKILKIYQADSISQIDLIELAIRNLKVKKTRTLITISGMSIGIAAIVFLVSIGYGLQSLVVSRVARLDEMKQTEIDPQTGGRLKITDATISSLNDISDVEMVLPLIAVVGRVNFQNSVSDMVAYGVTTDYLKQSAIQPVQGDIFSSNDISNLVSITKSEGTVAGIMNNNLEKSELGQEIGKVQYVISPGVWIRVREKPETNSKIIGYTRRMQDSGEGVEIWGEKFENNDKNSDSKEEFGKWIKGSVVLWEKGDCNNKEVCLDGKYAPLQNEAGQQNTTEGYFAELSITTTQVDSFEPKVLGEADSQIENQTSISNSASVDWVDLEAETQASNAAEQEKQISLPEGSIREAVVNRAMLKVLGINEMEAVGKTFNTSFVVVGNLLQDMKEKIESEPAEYTIVGVIPDDKTPLFYVPFVDLRSLGVVNYSQIKTVVKNTNVLGKVRQQIEAMGYATHSVVDTVNQVNNIFSTARTVLVLVGMVALAVASLGMFNTLTVSLLERIREIGLMKAMGMKSIEVKELFLTESMIMGFFGGILGIILGFLAGKAVGFILSIYSLSKGQGYLDISSIPIYFAASVILLSLTVGVVTGIYPARRAKKISALDALRYE